MNSKAMERRLLKIYARAGNQYQRGLNWYPKAQNTIAGLTELWNVHYIQAAAVVAVLSPRTPWEQNLKAANELAVTGRTTGIIGANVNKALRILANEHPENVLGGPKTKAFYANLCGDDHAVTIDTHMLKACKHHRTGCTLRQYERMAQAVTNAAHEAGLPPAKFQAVVWLAVRESIDYD